MFTSTVWNRNCLIRALLDVYKRQVSVPVTVKFRAGWDSEHINAEEIAVLAEKAGVAAVAVHGRTFFLPSVFSASLKLPKQE